MGLSRGAKSLYLTSTSTPPPPPAPRSDTCGQLHPVGADKRGGVIDREMRSLTHVSPAAMITAMGTDSTTETSERLLANLHQLRKIDWDNRVAYHPPRTLAVREAHEKARALVGQVGTELIDLLPPCPEIDRVLDALHIALMHANAAIALHHPENTG